MYLRFRCSRRGPGYHYPLGFEGEVPDELGEQFVSEKAAVKTAPKPAKPAPARPNARPAPPPAAGDDRSIDELDLDDSTKKVLRDLRPRDRRRSPRPSRPSRRFPASAKRPLPKSAKPPTRFEHRPISREIIFPTNGPRMLRGLFFVCDQAGPMAYDSSRRPRGRRTHSPAPNEHRTVGRFSLRVGKNPRHRNQQCRGRRRTSASRAVGPFIGSPARSSPEPFPSLHTRTSGPLMRVSEIR